MRNVLLLVALLAAACAASSVFPRDTGVIFAGDKALELVRQCSRRAPGPVSGTWTPTRSQIAELERRLPGVFNEAARQRWPRDHLNVTDYHRQYGGLIIDGRQIIYVSAGDQSLTERAPGGRFTGRTWRDLAFGVCDGGPIVFGVEYDPATRAFNNFAFNGAID